VQVVVISPEGDDPREPYVLRALFDAGLARYHVRKPAWSEARVEAWLRTLAPADRARVVVHQHHALVDRLGLGGRHHKDDGAAPGPRAPTGALATRACHDLASVRAALGVYDAVLFGPVFPSISKPGHGAGRSELDPAVRLDDLHEARARAAKRTSVLALGGITASRVDRCRAAGFDGVAVLGAVWSAPDPVAAYAQIRARADEPTARGTDS
jgi:thiamine-phosphate pyrophosphorylase